MAHVIVADDKQPILKQAERWFRDEFSDDPRMQLLTCSDLEGLTQKIEVIVASTGEVPLVFLDLDWGGDKSKSLKMISALKRSTLHRNCVVLIYSESEDQKYVDDAYSHFANGYVHKGNDDQEKQFIKTVKAWLKRIRMPSALASTQ